MARYLVYTAPGHGHVLPYVSGLAALAARGNEVHIRAFPAVLPALRDAGLIAESLAEGVLGVKAAFEAVGDKTAATDGFDIERLSTGHSDLFERGQFEIADLAAVVEEIKPDILLVDITCYGAQAQAEALGLPRGLLVPSVLPLPGSGIPPYGLGLAPATNLAGKLRDAALWRLVRRTFDSRMLERLNGMRASLGLQPITSGFDAFTNADVVLAISAPPLEYVRTDLPAHVRMVGAPPWDLPADRPAFLDEPGDPWVLVTCSTDYQQDERLAQIAVEALATEPVRVLLTAGDAMSTIELPDAPNVRVERFAPHGEILPMCSAVVSHGGMGITSRSLYCGVPQLIVPFGRDQPEIARRVSEAGAGEMLPAKKLDVESFRAAFRRVRALDVTGPSKRYREASDPELFADVAESLAPVGLK